MSLLLRLKNRGLPVLATAFPLLGERFAAGYRAERQEGGVPWAPVKRPLAAATIGLVTTAGVHHRTQTPYDMHDHDGDPSFRELDLSLPLDSLMITHDYYDHADADRDLNVVFPVERLRELAAAGTRVGYWLSAADAGRFDDAPIVVAAQDQADAAGAALGDRYVQEFYGLRPEVVLTLFIERDSWDRFIASRSRQD